MANARLGLTLSLPKIPDTFVSLEEVNTHLRALQRELDKHIAVRFGKFTKVIGDGSTSEFSIKHNLNTFDIHVSVYNTAAPYAEEKTHDIERVDANTVFIRFSAAPSIGSRRVVVFG